LASPTLLPRWFTGLFLTAVIVVVIPMLTVWPLKILWQEDAPRPLIEISDAPLSQRACKSHLNELLEQLQDYTEGTSKTSRNRGGEFWSETMHSWQEDLERVAGRCQLKPLASDADEAQKKLAGAYQKMSELSNLYVNALEHLSAKSNEMLKSVRQEIGAE
jgi:hypothetical protein